MSNVYILGGARTAFTAFGGSFQGVNATELGTVTAIEALKRAQVEGTDIDQVVYGNVIHSSTNAAYLARHIALKAGVSIDTPALTVNRLCGSGMQSIVSAAQSIRLGESNLALVGGAENMTMSPHANFSSRFSGVKYGNFQFEDMLLSTLTDQYTGSGMGVTAENLAEKYEISREEQDEFALLSQQRATEAINSGIFAEEITAVEIQSRGGNKVVDKDEHVKQDITIEKLSVLKPSFKKAGTVTAGNASGINDGAASIVVSSEAEVKRRNQTPLAKIVSWGITGVDPNIMGIGPVPAIQQALQRAGLTLDQIDRIEVNEAFAAQYLAVEKELSLDRAKTNVHGGAIALGHPVGASGSRIVLSLANELKRNGLRYGVASLCIGGGQGIALVIENENV
ncbi:acetyl-CoA C-acetyltransferase [Alkalihalobacillus sp. BA299]|uniref:acetyl-CoA C-acetyltransferase n=1 Tax=Alkalihalobacillus sp. BA299 TaxID=2815938 RepID=UPI001ADBC945|nr:acetyl-CoA C-acetyltransferase [Alkalihalobacillus sp. BA299]